MPPKNIHLLGCPPGCTCNRHIPEIHSHPCSPGCTCGRHNPKRDTRFKRDPNNTPSNDHRMIQRERGKAAEYICSVKRCKEQAKHWAFAHTWPDADKDDIWSYAPMCEKHHLAYDKKFRNNEKQRELALQMVVARNKTKKQRDASSAYAQARPRTEGGRFVLCLQRTYTSWVLTQEV